VTAPDSIQLTCFQHGKRKRSPYIRTVTYTPPGSGGESSGPRPLPGPEAKWSRKRVTPPSTPDFTRVRQHLPSPYLRRLSPEPPPCSSHWRQFSR